jgi:hypothetical protein
MPSRDVTAGKSSLWFTARMALRNLVEEIGLPRPRAPTSKLRKNLDTTRRHRRDPQRQLALTSASLGDSLVAALFAIVLAIQSVETVCRHSRALSHGARRSPAAAS